MKKFGYVLATKMLVDGKKKVMYMYHEKPDNTQDSGWRFFCGEEDEAYVNNPDNIAIYDINTILALDSSISPYLDSVIGIAFERENPDTTFTLIEQFSAEEGE
jgi:hypothetical protein